MENLTKQILDYKKALHAMDEYLNRENPEDANISISISYRAMNEKWEYEFETVSLTDLCKPLSNSLGTRNYILLEKAVMEQELKNLKNKLIEELQK